MSRNGSGVYSLPAGNPVVPSTTISTTWANTTLTDIASALTGSVASDGQTPMSSSLNMANNKIVSVLDPTNAQDAATKVYVDTAITTAVAVINSVPTGSIQMWPTASAPTGYLLCAGAAVSRITYATLFALIGTTFGVGDGSTTFNLPNYTDKFPYGTTVAATGGSADAVVVSHTHTATTTATDSGHTHLSNAMGLINGTINFTGTGGTPYNNGNNTNTASSTANITATTTIDTAGASGTNANLPPYYALAYIMKA
jgi:microcystin-dependent protein